MYLGLRQAWGFTAPGSLERPNTRSIRNDNNGNDNYNNDDYNSDSDNNNNDIITITNTTNSENDRGDDNVNDNSLPSVPPPSSLASAGSATLRKIKSRISP